MRSRVALETEPNTATCHCGRVRIHVRQLPRTLTKCDCSICRRYGALWAYYQPSSVRVEAPRSGLDTYAWNRRIREYHRCKNCGCITHYTYRKKRSSDTVAVNANNFELSAIAGSRVRHLTRSRI
jgi:hypothetical protein